MENLLSYYGKIMEERILLEDINNVLLDPEYTLKILNKKLNDYINFKNLFLYFRLPKKVQRNKSQPQK